MIRKAEEKDISRIAEILVFTKRMKYRAIFHNDDYSFNELQVVKVANEFKDPELLNKVWVYDDGIVKGMMHLEGKEISELYADYFFWNQGIGTMIVNHLVDYAVKNSSTGKFTTIGGVSSNGKEGFYKKLGFEVIPNGIRKMIEI